MHPILNWLSAIFLYRIPWPRLGWYLAGGLGVALGAMIIFWWLSR